MLEIMSDRSTRQDSMTDIEDSEFLLREMEFTPVSTTTADAKGGYADTSTVEGVGPSSLEPQPPQMPTSSSEEVQGPVQGHTRKNASGKKLKGIFIDCVLMVEKRLWFVLKILNVVS